MENKGRQREFSRTVASLLIGETVEIDYVGESMVAPLEFLEHELIFTNLSDLREVSMTVNRTAREGFFTTISSKA